MKRPFINTILNAVLAPKESAHQFDTTRRIRAFFTAVENGDAAHVNKFLKEGVDTDGYENRNFGSHGTKQWLLSGLFAALENGRPAVVELLVTRFLEDTIRQLKQCEPKMQNFLFSQIDQLAALMSNNARIRTMTVNNNILAESILLAAHKPAKPPKDCSDWRRGINGKRTASQLASDFNEVAIVLETVCEKKIRDAASELIMQHEERVAAERRKMEKERAAAAEKAKISELAKSPQEAIRIKRSLRPLKTVKFKSAS